MGHIIIHQDGRYNIYSTIVDACLFESALTLDQLTAHIKEEHGNQGLASLPVRLDRAHIRGTSSMTDISLVDTVDRNSQGLPVEEFVAKFLSFAPK